MIVDLEDKEFSGWFNIKGGGRVNLRLRNEQDEKDIRAACISTIVEYPLLDGKYERFESEKTDIELYVTMSWDRNIKSWEGIFDKKKRAIPVNAENKALLMKRYPPFREAVEAGSKARKADESKKSAVAEKNSQTGLSSAESKPETD